MLKKVIIASTSSFRRTYLSEMLASHKKISIVDNVRNGNEASEIIRKKNPDVLILDIEFDNEDWYNQFYPIIKNYLINTIVLTDKNPKMLDTAKIPLILKSYDYIVKPEGIWKEELPKIKDKIISKVLMADIPKAHKIDSKSRLMSKNIFIQQSQKLQPARAKRSEEFKHKFKQDLNPRLEEYFLELIPVSTVNLNSKIIVMGASVGGPRTLRTIFSDIPVGFPVPILVVQHINHLFLRQLVTSLRPICKVKVKIGSNYEEIQPGTIYFSPGDKHMQVTVKKNKPCLRTFEGEPVNYCRPSVDVLFYSTTKLYKKKTLSIFLTGIGRDAVNGLHEIKTKGGKTIAESKETSVLYGMPKVAAETGAANLIVPNFRIVDEMIKFIR
ncbi:MAG: chemotaxis protein CheB [Promethearchaeota archaeon]|jgi:two-component system chemotaxis response regulator CheB